MATRSTTFDLIPVAADDAAQMLRRRIVQSIRQYRAVLRESFGLLAACQMAGASIEWRDDGEIRITPNRHAAKVICALATGQADAVLIPPAGDRVRGAGDRFEVRVGRGAAYELRAFINEQLPSSLSFVGDSLRRDLNTAWQARDPEFPQANRGWLTLQGARNIAQFNRRGIGLPPTTARPKLEGYKLRLKWDHEIGAVEFKVGDLDRGRRHVWLSLRDGDEGWKLDTIYLNERDGKLLATVSHERPDDIRLLDASRVCSVRFDTADQGRGFIRIVGPDGAETADSIDAAGAVATLAHLRERRERLERRRGANGAPRRPWGYRKGWETAQAVLERNTALRTKRVAEFNHAWARRVTVRAVGWRCGTIAVAPHPETLFGHSWAWSQLLDHLRYKGEFHGIAIVESAST